MSQSPPRKKKAPVRGQNTAGQTARPTDPPPTDPPLDDRPHTDSLPEDSPRDDPPRTNPPRGAGRNAILAAAREEFDEVGFEGTNTNRIARRAGYAPQTFYRHFSDKTAVFVEIYHRWLEDEWRDLEKAHGEKGADNAARILLRHHLTHREFRRSLRRLTVTDPAVRTARAKSRNHQVDLVDARLAAQGRKRERNSSIALLLCIERIADAAADGELNDLGLSPEDQEAMLTKVMRRLGTGD